MQTSTDFGGGNQAAYVRKQELNGRLGALEIEINDIDADIQRLQELKNRLLAEKRDISVQLKTHGGRLQGLPESTANGHGPQRVESGKTDYTTERFEWTGELKARMKAIFNIGAFRLCQEGVCNANMDGRDIVCVMPTGGGKSLTYQLPALLNPGCTLVISPLISLITDQILHLREYGVEAVKLTGSTSKEETRDIFSRLTYSAGVRSKSAMGGSSGPEIKLCYVTPEKIAKSKTFMSMLEKLANAGKLARIVIDEAHCVSQLGHDFRPDYKKLSILRQLFPRVPILALSATCPPKVLKDLVLTLRLKPTVPGTAANTDGTVYFSAPLYRKNLHYKVLPKPSSSSAAIQAMADYVMEKHREDSGIVYCLSKKDTETVAEGLRKASDGKIRTGVYHSDVHDKDKEGLHQKWRRGEIKVVCATIAFGLGIDKGDVRFVLHHSMSKSLDGYYQESGRAGRDGKDSDCILYYRPQDATRLSALICGELEGQDKLQDMLRFAQDVEECRKLQFAKYFSTSSSLSMSAWGTAESDATARCGHCDNCTRPPETIDRRDVTLAAWQIVKVVASMEREGGRVTVGMLTDLVRGVGGGAYGVRGGGKRGKGKAKEKVDLDLDDIAGGKVTLGKDETETVVIHLLLSHHLKESFHTTAYAINVYVIPGQEALRLARCSREDIESGKGPRVSVTFLKKPAKKTTRRQPSGSGSQSTLDNQVSKAQIGKKRKRGQAVVEDETDEEIMPYFIDDDLENVTMMSDIEEEPQPVSNQCRSHRRRKEATVLSDSEDDGDDWAFTLSRTSAPKKGGVTSRAPTRTNSQAIWDEKVIILSD